MGKRSRSKKDEVLHYVKYLTDSIRSSSSSGSNRGSRRHSLNRRRSRSQSNRGSGTSLCEVPDWKYW